MPRFNVSAIAQADLREIVRYTNDFWGESQAKKYVRELHLCFQKLADNPGIGRSAEAISVGLQRHESGKHIVFYKQIKNGVRIVRVLHQQMLPDRKRFLD